MYSAPSGPDGHTMRTAEFTLQRIAIEPRGTGFASARDSCNQAGSRRVAADHMVLRVGNQDRAIAIQRDVFGAIHGRLQPRSPIAAQALCPGADHRFDPAC